MRCILLFFFLGTLQIAANVTYSQSVKLSLDVKDATIQDVLSVIEQKSSFYFTYNLKQINANRKVSVKVNDKSVTEVLDLLFSGKDVKYTINDKHIVLYKADKEIPMPVIHQFKGISGVVTDEKGEPIIGANVMEKGTNNGTITDLNGRYTLNVSGKSIVYSYIGYISQEIDIRNESVINVKLIEDTQKLEEVVIVGYGTQKKVNLTGSVSTVNAEEMSELPVSSLSNALGGRMAGVLVTQSGGKPGAGSSITIRSKGTWNNTDPLYVIDGIIRDKFAFDGLNANDIESLSVLKDGSSAAIYGARAANGVVLVNTKKGKIGKPVISYVGSVGISDATKIPDVQLGYEKAITMNNSFRAQNIDPSDSRYYTQDELDFFKENRWKWLDEAWKKPLLTQHSINVNGGNDRVRYFIGGSYYYETGSFDNLNFKKYNLRSNLEANITKDLTVSMNLDMDIRDDRKPYWEYDNDNDTMADLYKNLLYRTGQIPPYIDGKAVGNFISWHPLEIISDHTGYNKKKYSTYNANIVFQYNVPFIKGLNLKLVYNLEERHIFRKEFLRPFDLYVFKTRGGHNHIVTNEVDYVKSVSFGDFLKERYDRKNNYQLNGFITYNQRFGKHDVGALFVYEQSEGTLDWFDGRRNYFISSAIDQLFAGSSDSKDSTVDGKGEESGRISYVGRLNYGYDEKYLIEASFRYDGSVNFAPNKRWGFFPSVSAAWRVSEEKFFKDNVRFINYLKIRGSVGLLGNDGIGGWQWMQRYNLVSGAQFGSLSSGTEANVFPNTDITWEKSLTYNGGFDANFINNKLVLSFDAFYRHTYDILGNRLASLPTTFGSNLPAENYGVIDAKGFELELGYSDKIGDDFRFDVRGNLGYAVNKLKTKDEPENIRSYKSEIGYNTDRRMGLIATGIIRTQADLDALPEGYTIFGQKPQLGMLNFKDLRGVSSDEPDGIIDDNDKDWIINHTSPPVTYGFSLGGTWKGISLDILFQGVAGNDIMISAREPQVREQQSDFSFWDDHWTPENVNASFPRPVGSDPSKQESTFWVRNGSFLRLKNVNLSYTFPNAVLSKLGVSQLKFFLTGSNLFLLQDKVKYYDPENSDIFAYPLMKSYSMGINLSF